ncbi:MULTISPECIES: membrane protein insertase YidC [Sporosarcina]|uniref:membrane protein insertase YidC n=1 Tax=Sporosarcina TaxID=1569 RepID=UPI0006945AFD|nr:MULTISPECIES: membrane protein insertase YidC [Sporosarcina]WJY27156.1 membrane protein insertase YidC [Sporosarcina sp. 0.2-SM1T-5]
MKKRIGFVTMLATAAVLLSGCTSVQEQRGTFYGIFVKPMEWLLHNLGEAFNGSYGLAIIVITMAIRLLLMPLMLKNYKSQQEMKVKMDALKPEMEVIQKQMKEAQKAGNKEQQMKLQQEMMGLYSKHNVNPLNMGCLPLIIQMPIIMGLYFAILYADETIKSHQFLWFELGKPDIIMMLVAGAVYFVQARVSLWTMPEQQKQQMKLFVYISPIMIMFISYRVAAALPLYWAVGGLFMIFQTYLGRKFYYKHTAAELEVEPDGQVDVEIVDPADEKKHTGKKKSK